MKDTACSPNSSNFLTYRLFRGCAQAVCSHNAGSSSNRLPMRRIFSTLALLCAFIVGFASHGAQETRLHDLLPENLKVAREVPSEIEGVTLVELNDGSFLYVFDGQPYFFSGNLFRFSESGISNLSEEYRSEQRKDILGSIDPGEAVIFPASNPLRETLWVFTDVTCGYCQLFHREMTAYNALGLEVRYLAFPRFGMESESGELLQTAWCAEDRRDAITRLKAGESLPPKQCNSPVEGHYLLGQRLGVNGTPAIFSGSGVQLPGFVPPDQIMARLGLSQETPD